jgi:hypothetical protein
MAPGLLGSFQLLLGILKTSFYWYVLWRALFRVRSQLSSLVEMECGKIILTMENTRRNFHDSFHEIKISKTRKKSIFMDLADIVYNQLNKGLDVD